MVDDLQATCPDSLSPQPHWQAGGGVTEPGGGNPPQKNDTVELSNPRQAESPCYHAVGWGFLVHTVRCLVPSVPGFISATSQHRPPPRPLPFTARSPGRGRGIPNRRVHLLSAHMSFLVLLHNLHLTKTTGHLGNLTFNTLWWIMYRRQGINTIHIPYFQAGDTVNRNGKTFRECIAINFWKGRADVFIYSLRLISLDLV